MVLSLPEASLCLSVWVGSMCRKEYWMFVLCAAAFFYVNFPQGAFFVCRLVFCNYNDPVCGSVLICSPKGVDVQCEGILNL